MTKRGSSVMNYPGGKTVIASWIIDHIPDHDCYVEPFGGSASVLMQKPRSKVEVYNDLDSELYDFFVALRDHGDDLRDWLTNTPYSRELFDEWIQDRRDGNAPEELVERAGRQFALRQMSYGAKLNPPSFRAVRSVRQKNEAPGAKLRLAVDNLDTVRDRFRDVTLEHLDFEACIEKYDCPEAFFYIDPPYVGCDYYSVGDMDHERLIGCLDRIDGMWALSYDNLPDSLDTSSYHITSRDRTWNLDSSKTAAGSENLVMNYDPFSKPSFSPENQNLAAFTDGGSE